MDTKKAFEVITAVLIPYWLVIFSSLKNSLPTDKKTRQLFLISLALLILTMVSKRFAEYSVPVTLWFCASYFSKFFEIWTFKKLSEKFGKISYGLYGFAAILILVLFIRSYKDVSQQFHSGESMFKPAAEYLLAHASKDKMIFTCDWDDTPELFFYDSEHTYPVFLDPNFMYFWDKDIWNNWFRVANGMEQGQSYYFFKNFFKVDYGVCTTNFKKLEQIINMDPRMEVVYKNQGVYVFRVK